MYLQTDRRRAIEEECYGKVHKKLLCNSNNIQTYGNDGKIPNRPVFTSLRSAKKKKLNNRKREEENVFEQFMRIVFVHSEKLHAETWIDS